VQVDPTKPQLKPPGTKRLKQNCDILLSTSAFKSNLRRYDVVDEDSSLEPYQLRPGHPPVWRTDSVMLSPSPAESLIPSARSVMPLSEGDNF